MDYLELVRLYEGDAKTDVVGFLKKHSDDVYASLREKGAVLLRGFGAALGDQVAEGGLKILSPELLEDAFWSTPRSAIKGKTFTATEYPGPRTIALHSEMAYMTTFPRLLSFHSLVVADEGGETTLGNLDAISDALGDILPKFEGGVIYKRSYHPGLDIPWRQAFRVSDKSEVEQIAKKTGMTLNWVDDETLQTQHRAQGCIKSEDGKLIWFNQAHVFHASNLSEKDRSTLTSLFGADGLPRDAIFADGSNITDEMVQKIHSTLESHTVGVKWQAGDLLFVDNLRMMHGRAPYKGNRKLHVAMARAHKDPHRTPLGPEEKKGFGAFLWGRRAS